MFKNRVRLRTLAVALPLMLLTAGHLQAAEEQQAGKWQWYGELFAQGAQLDGTASTGEDIEVPLHDVLDNLDFAFMGSLAVRKNKLTLFGNFIYANLGERATIPLDTPTPLEADLNLDIKQYISTFGAAYEIADTGRSTFNLLAGGRYLLIDADLKYDIAPNASGREKDSESNWDFIVGARGTTELNDKWYVHYYADIGTGNSDMTWQAIAGVNYRLSKVDLTLGYAYMDWDFDKKSLVRDISIKGPYAGIKFAF